MNTTPVRSSKEYTQKSPPLPRDAPATVRRVEDHRDLSSEFKQLEVNDTNGSPIARKPVSEQVAKDGYGQNGSPRNMNFASAEDPYSESVADFNIARDESMLAGGLEDKHAIRQALERDQREDGVQPRRSRDVNRDVINVRRSNDLARPGSSRLSNDVARPGSSRLSNDASRNAISAGAIPSREASLDWQRQNGSTTRPRGNTVNKRLSMDKPLPVAPEGQAVKNFSTPSTQPRAQPEHLVHDSDKPIDLAAHGIDLTNTEDTTVYKTQAPAVVHETVRVDTHEIITERIEREIHTHDVYHRILPIVDVEVLPPRHFIQTPAGGRYEISEEQAPGGAAQNLNLQRVIQEAVDRELARLYPPQTGPRRFTALQFPGTAGDHRSGVGEDGCQFSEQTWVHPPVIDMGAYESGQTVPFHFDHQGKQASAGGIVGEGNMVYDDHKGGVGRLPDGTMVRVYDDAEVPGVGPARRGSVARKPVPS